MIKNTIKLLLVGALVVSTSCKKKDEFAVQQLDAKNNVVAQGQLAMQDDRMKKKLKPEDYPVIEFETKEFDFGNIKQGQKVEHVFKFKNAGKNDLHVIDVRPSCGCTAPEWTKTPLKKGETGEIKIVFDSKGKSGAQTKSISLLTNTESGSEVLTFKANILTDGIGAPVEAHSTTENHNHKH